MHYYNGINIKNLLLIVLYVNDYKSFNYVKSKAKLSKLQIELDTEMKIYLDVLDRLINCNFQNDYVEFNERSQNVKGKILFKESILDLALRSGYVNQIIEDYNINNSLNQELKFVLNSIKKNCDTKYINKVKNILNYLNSVEEIDFKRYSKLIKFPVVSTNMYYRIARVIGMMIILRLYPYEEIDKYLDSLDLDTYLPLMFQKFVKKMASVHYSNIKVSSPILKWSDVSHVFLNQLETDIVLEFPDVIIIIEVKYYKEILKTNRFNEKKINNQNLFQLYSYMNRMKYDSKKPIRGILLYAESIKEVIDLNFKVDDSAISVRTLSLNNDIIDIEADLVSIINSSLY